MPSKRAVKYAQALRKWASENPKTDFALGFVPVAGQLYGAAHAVAANIDPEAGALDRTLATAGILPVGKLAGAARKVVIGARGAKGAEKKLLQKAAALQRRGLDTDEIYDQTGWWYYNHPFHHGWYREIPEEGFAVAPLDEFVPNAPDKVWKGKVKDVVRGSPTLERYPEASLMEFKFEGANPKSGGSFSPGLDPRDWGPLSSEARIRVLGGEKEIPEVMAHELQHATDWLEKRSTYGANSAPEHGGWWTYMTDPGEMRARVTAQRLRMTPAERQQFPYHKHFAKENERLMRKGAEVTLDPSAEEYAEIFKDSGINPVDLLLRGVEVK